MLRYCLFHSYQFLSADYNFIRTETMNI